MGYFLTDADKAHLWQRVIPFKSTKNHILFTSDSVRNPATPFEYCIRVEILNDRDRYGEFPFYKLAITRVLGVVEAYHSYKYIDWVPSSFLLLTARKQMLEEQYEFEEFRREAFEVFNLTTQIDDAVEAILSDSFFRGR